MGNEMRNEAANLHFLHENGDIVEVRSVDPKPVVSGYFAVGVDDDILMKELARFPNRTFYQTMNVVNRGCYSRGQSNHLVERPKETTSDGDTKGIQWILIDTDPERVSGVSSTKEEKEKALEVSRNVYRYLKRAGFESPIICDSGNGYHLLYKVQFNPSDSEIIKNFLSVIDMWFSTDDVKIDKSVFNPSRITKLYGTVARKGASTEDRPHRRSKIIDVPSEIRYTSADIVNRIASEWKSYTDTAPKKTVYNGEGFDIEKFISEHNIGISKRVRMSDGTTKYILEECPFDANHRAPDSAIFVRGDGAIGFKCLHNHCIGKGWRDVRSFYDPSAYDKDTTAYQTWYTDFEKLHASPSEKERDFDSQVGAMLDITQVNDYDVQRSVVIKSGISTLDNAIGGFTKGQLTVWSGGNASGKSTIVSQLGLEAVQQGFKVALFSGEMTPVRVKYWLYLQAAGRDGVDLDNDGLHYKLKSGAKEKLDELLKGNFALYNNDFGLGVDAVMSGIVPWVEEEKADVVIIDNLMAMEDGGSDGKYDRQSRIVKQFSQLAKKLEIHIHFICHPRKSTGFLRKQDISGSSDISNAADNIIMVHRNNRDFQNGVKEVFKGYKVDEEIGNILEVMKCRDLGVNDTLVNLYFDASCKTVSDIRGGKPMMVFQEEIEEAYDDCPWGYGS